MSDKLKKIKARGLKDLYFFDKQILGYSKMRPVPHQELCDVVTDGQHNKKLILMPRGSFKSSVVTVGYSVWSLVKDPNKRILITHELQKNANKYVGEVKDHFEKNLKLKSLYGDLRSKELWRNNEILLNNRTRILKEPSVTAGSLEKGVAVGMHYDIIIVDDPVSSRNSNNLDQVEKTIDYYKLLMSILEPGGTLIIIGTRWNINDLYGWIQDPKGTEKNKFDIIIKKAIDAQGKYLMPDVLSPAFLEDVKETQGETIFSHQYLNEPLIEGDRTFNPDDVQWYKETPNGLIYFLSVDCAMGLDRRSDYTAFVLVGVDYAHNYFVEEAFQLKIKVAETIEQIFRLTEKYTPFMTMGIEVSMADQAVTQHLYSEMERRKSWFAIKELREESRKAKEERIRWLQPKMSAKKIYLRKEHVDLYDQIQFYPQCKHDDLIDALKSHVKITFPSDVTPLQADKFGALSPAERRIWQHVEDLGKRRVKRRRGRVI